MTDWRKHAKLCAKSVFYLQTGQHGVLVFLCVLGLGIAIHIWDNAGKT